MSSLLFHTQPWCVEHGMGPSRRKMRQQRQLCKQRNTIYVRLGLLIHLIAGLLLIFLFHTYSWIRFAESAAYAISICLRPTDGWKNIVQYSLSIRMTRVWPDMPRPNSHPLRLTPCSNLLFRSLTPIRTYNTQINVIGPKKNRKLDISKACSTSTFFTCRRKIYKRKKEIQYHL